ncbi:MAG: PIG-L family deacetylase [Ruminococcaceae bacterium]|nr:PIG-L family deacetylase [Oscillospiraceae bacterium]
MDFTYCNTDTKEVTKDINLLFPDFGKDEVLAVMSPHDDDAIIGAGYAMLAAQKAGADVYVVIFCRGDAGYSTVEEKETIEAVRCKETFDCYARLGIPADHILRMNYPDFSAIGNWGWEKADGKPGDMPTILRFLREKKVTRVMIPNHYHEHIDHVATYLMSSYDVPQAGDMALVDHGTPHAVRSTLQYSVWADFDPEDAMVNGRPSCLRANRILAVSADVEEKIDDAIAAYVSQEQIIKNLVASRVERKTAKGTFVEPYIAFDCRPKINLKPYIDWVEKMV